MANKISDRSRENRQAAEKTVRQEVQATIRQAMADWDAATPEQREVALAGAARRARVTELAQAAIRAASPRARGLI